MIDTTLGHLVNAEAALTRLADRPLPARVGYGLAKLVTAVRTEAAAFQTERQKLVQRRGTTRDATPEERPTMGPQVITVADDQFAAFAAEVTDLAAVGVTLPLEPFDLDALGDEMISAADIAALGPLVTLNGSGGAP